MAMTTEFYGSLQPVQEEKFLAMKARIPEIIAKISKGLVLDVGCGTGLFQKKMPGEYIGLDVDEKMLRKSASIFPRVIGDGKELPFSDYSFDSIVSTDAMHLVKGADFHRVLKPGGIVLLSTFFNNENFESKKSMILGKVKGFSIIEEFTLNTKEEEYVVVAQKPAFD